MEETRFCEAMGMTRWNEVGQWNRLPLTLQMGREKVVMAQMVNK